MHCAQGQGHGKGQGRDHVGGRRWFKGGDGRGCFADGGGEVKVYLATCNGQVGAAQRKGDRGGGDTLQKFDTVGNVQIGFVSGTFGYAMRCRAMVVKHVAVLR